MTNYKEQLVLIKNKLINCKLNNKTKMKNKRNNQKRSHLKKKHKSNTLQRNL